MTGPDHYIEAENLIEQANEVGHEDPIRGAGILAAAQVHATLALAAATAMAGRGTPDEEGIPRPVGMHRADFEAWDGAAGVQS